MARSLHKFLNQLHRMAKAIIVIQSSPKLFSAQGSLGSIVSDDVTEERSPRTCSLDRSHPRLCAANERRENPKGLN